MRKRISASIKAGLVAIGWLAFLNLSFAGTVTLPKTGQTICYDTAGNIIPCAGTGQDGDIEAGVAWPSTRFTDNGDGTITDNLTDLMWLKDASCLTKGIWQGTLDSVADFNTNPENYKCVEYTAKYNDWVPPNIIELESLFNAAVANSASWLLENGFLNIEPGPIGSYSSWASTTYGKFSNEAWLIVPSVCNAYTFHKISAYKYGWPVRTKQAIASHDLDILGATNSIHLPKTGQTIIYATGDDGDLQRGVTWPVPRFTDNENGTVTDNLTGLMWLKHANCFGHITWQEALDKIADFNANPGSSSCGQYVAAYSDWRLPNWKELRSLTDFSRFTPVLPSEHPFLDVQTSGHYWSSTTYTNIPKLAWSMNIGNGDLSRDTKSDSHYAWPVRAGASTIYVSQDEICGGKSPCYSAIQAAINEAGNGATIKIAQGAYSASISLNTAKSLILKGGWNYPYSSQTPNTTFIKAPKAPQGSLTLQMLTIKP